MSSTRHAKEGSTLRQERFASSFEQGILANLVAKRCAAIEQPEARAAIWFVQWQSWLIGTARFLHEMRRALKLPEVEPDSMHEWIEGLQTMCLNPRCTVDGWMDEDSYGNCAPVYTEDWAHLKSYRSKWISELPALTETSVSQRVFGALDYTRDARTLTLIDGPARIGKSFSARACCDRTAGLARYVQVPCSNDDIGFFRAIGRPLGVSASLQMKASEIRNRIEEVLQKGDLMLVLDESQYCWPQSWQRYAMPSRVNWILQALVNYSVPVALVTTPLFYTSQKRVEELTGWTSEQLIGRIGHVERLPNKLGRADLVKVAKALLPGGDGATWGALAAYADVSKKHLASIEAIAKRSAWLASQDGKQTATAAHVRRAMKESVIPSDTALAESLAPARNARRNTFARLPRPSGGYAAATATTPADYTHRGGLCVEQRGGLSSV
jgi:hypothetical protein